MNVITGGSGKWKLSILLFIDYCLLSTKSTVISKTVIDSEVYWYGIKISINENFIALPSEINKVIVLAFFDKNVFIQPLPTLNVRIENLKKVLSGGFGIDSELRLHY